MINFQRTLHGLENQIEGDLRPRQSVVIVENQVNAGNNCVKVVEALRNNGCKVLGIVTIFDYEFPNTQRKLDKLGVDLTALTNLDTVLHHAGFMNMVSAEEQQAIKDWQIKPSKWNK